MTATAYPSGSGLGHTVWVLNESKMRVGYLSRVALDPGHSLAFEPNTLRHLDALVLAPGALSRSASHTDSSVQDGTTGGAAHSVVSTNSTADVAAAAAAAAAAALALSQAQRLSGLHGPVLAALAAGGSVLLPLQPTGVAWDIIESLGELLPARGFGGVPILYIAASAGASLALANTSMEALSRYRQARVYVPESPFAFDAMVQSGQLLVAATLSDPAVQSRLHQRCVVLVAAASLRAGPGLELLMRWGGDPSCAVVTADAERVSRAPPDLQRHLPPGSTPLRLRQVACCHPSGTRPSAQQMAQLLAGAAVRRLLVDASDYALLRQVPGEARGVFATESVTQYRWLEAVTVSVPRGPRPAGVLNPAVLERVLWMDMGGGVRIGRLTCNIKVAQGDTWRLDVLDTDADNQPAAPPAPRAGVGSTTAHQPSSASGGASATSVPSVPHHTSPAAPLLWGRLQVLNLRQALQAHGFAELTCSTTTAARHPPTISTTAATRPLTLMMSASPAEGPASLPTQQGSQQPQPTLPAGSGSGGGDMVAMLAAIAPRAGIADHTMQPHNASQQQQQQEHVSGPAATAMQASEAVAAAATRQQDEEGEGGQKVTCIHIEQHGAEIRLSSSWAHITAADPRTRAALADIVMSQLNVL